MISVKNVILYDPYQHVSGFAELKTGRGGTHIKVKHNLSDRDLLVSVIYGGESHVLTMTDRVGDFQINPVLDLTREVMVCLMRREGNTVLNLATGVINLSANKSSLATIIEETAQTPINRETAAGIVIARCSRSECEAKQPPGKNAPDFNTTAAREVDELLRKVCSLDAEGKGQCEKCPYREFFYGETYIVGGTPELLSKPL